MIEETAFETAFSKSQTTPAQITDRIREWCAQISPSPLVYVPTQTARGQRAVCYINCVSYHLQNGGEIISGWIIWEAAHILEAEHHAVIRTADGSLYDPTPPVDGESRLLFLPDAKRTAKIEMRDVLLYRNIVYPNVKTKPKRVPKVVNLTLQVDVLPIPVMDAKSRAVLIDFW